MCFATALAVYSWLSLSELPWSIMITMFFLCGANVETITFLKLQKLYVTQVHARCMLDINVWHIKLICELIFFTHYCARHVGIIKRTFGEQQSKVNVQNASLSEFYHTFLYLVSALPVVSSLLPVSLILQISAVAVREILKVVCWEFILNTMSRDEILPFDTGDVLNIVLKYWCRQEGKINGQSDFRFVQVTSSRKPIASWIEND